MFRAIFDLINLRALLTGRRVGKGAVYGLLVGMAGICEPVMLLSILATPLMGSSCT